MSGAIKAILCFEASLRAPLFCIKLSSLQVNPERKYNPGTLPCDDFSGKNTLNFIVQPNSRDSCSYLITWPLKALLREISFSDMVEMLWLRRLLFMTLSGLRKPV